MDRFMAQTVVIASWVKINLQNHPVLYVNYMQYFLYVKNNQTGPHTHTIHARGRRGSFIWIKVSQVSGRLHLNLRSHLFSFFLIFFFGSQNRESYSCSESTNRRVPLAARGRSGCTSLSRRGCGFPLGRLTPAIRTLLIFCFQLLVTS